MEKRLAPALGSLLIGMMLIAITGLSPAPKSFMLENQSAYDFETTVERFEVELKEAGWSIITIHDMQKTLQRHGQEVAPVKVFELCSAKYSSKILKHDDERIISALMPCRVSIYEKSDGNTYISRMDLNYVGQVYGGVIKDVMDEVAIETEKLIAKLVK